MASLTLSETMVQLSFLESVKAVFDKFLDIFQMEGSLIHVLHSYMLLLLKQMMCRFHKQSAIEKKSVTELLKLDIKNTDIQVKDSELETVCLLDKL